MRRLTLRHPRGATSIVVGEGALAAATPELAAWLADRSVFVVASERVAKLHGDPLAEALGAGRRVEWLQVPDGEEAKSLAVAERLWRRMAAAGGKRDSRVVAFGGGCVTDLAGFVAGCFLRGVEVALLPTTLLAQVDAAIGGKTAVDLPEGKNAVGLFHHPRLVVAEARWLATLPADELRAGLVEVAKITFLLEPDLFERLEGTLAAILAGDGAALGEVAAGAVAAKAAVVERDPEEGGERKLLNFGHTLGHALEAAGGYRALRHGEAVAYGLLFALRLSVARGLPAPDAARLSDLLRRLEPPPLPAFEPAALLELLGRDKKARESGLGWVLARRPGRGEVVTVPPAEVLAALRDFLAAPWGAADRL